MGSSFLDESDDLDAALAFRQFSIIVASSKNLARRSFILCNVWLDLTVSEVGIRFSFVLLRMGESSEHLKQKFLCLSRLKAVLLALSDRHAYASETTLKAISALGCLFLSGWSCKAARNENAHNIKPVIVH